MTNLIPNVLAERYASPEMCAIWSGECKVQLEREFWVAVMKAQKDLGLSIPYGVIEDYEKVIGQVDLESIRKREEGNQRTLLNDHNDNNNVNRTLNGHEAGHYITRSYTNASITAT